MTEMVFRRVPAFFVLKTALFVPSKSAQKPAPQTKKAKICVVKAKTGDWRGFASKPSPFFHAFTPCFLYAFFAERGIEVCGKAAP
ncbi:MAG: hypothetical protein K2K43_01935 [Alistipes sp.]|nr:hypothetical protein [Alistipes sp.]